MYERLSSLADRLDQVRDTSMTEEATKTALVLPMIRELGYDVFNPKEVIPEFTADVGIKKGEKVDYAICQDGMPIILFECKPMGAKLESYSSQLYRYFSTTRARIAILTDGVIYRFYSDLVETNILDSKPFLVMNLDRLSKDVADRIEPFTKENFSLDSVLADAALLYAKSQIRERFAKELSSPSDDLVRYFADPIHNGPMRQNVLDKYRPIVRGAMLDHITSTIESRLRSAIQSSNEEEIQSAQPESDSDLVATTEEELNGFYAVKAILCTEVEPKRICARDVQSYFGVLLDDNNRKPICRLHFNRKQKYLGVFNEKREEERIPISSVDELFVHSQRIKDSLNKVL
ncbi:MAG: type I restriction enzyme HsdR N-terminal domain-containing protein [Phycisphaerales bacterium]|nr:type I restriction enzyme HsdR N-terminal domain-containing protein [Phycisphaerales bacterium]